MRFPSRDFLAINDSRLMIAIYRIAGQVRTTFITVVCQATGTEATKKSSLAKAGEAAPYYPVLLSELFGVYVRADCVDRKRPMLASGANLGSNSFPSSGNLTCHTERAGYNECNVAIVLAADRRSARDC